jgi:hypothetical protein
MTQPRVRPAQRRWVATLAVLLLAATSRAQTSLRPQTPATAVHTHVHFIDRCLVGGSILPAQSKPASGLLRH